MSNEANKPTAEDYVSALLLIRMSNGWRYLSGETQQVIKDLIEGKKIVRREEDLPYAPGRDSLP